MTDVRKSAYRYLLYQAMLDIRVWGDWSSEESSDPEIWKRRYLTSRFAGVTAYWLHNLALAAAEDFHGFDEVSFWKSHQHWSERFPLASLERYRTVFEERLAMQ